MLWETWHRSKAKMGSVISIASLIFGFVGGLSELNTLYVLLTLLGITLLICLGIAAKEFLKVKRGNIVEKISQNRSLRLMVGDFKDNMRSFLRDLSPAELQETVFAMGFDRSGRLDESTRGGIIRAVIGLLEEDYQLSIEQFQTALNEEMVRFNRTPGQPLQYGECFAVELPVKRGNENIQVNILLIANSEKENPLHKENIVGRDSRLMVQKIFDYLQESNKYSRLVMGVMGTNGPNYPYHIVYNEIISCFALKEFQSKNNNAFNVMETVISTRDIDFKRHGISLSQLEEHMRSFVSFVGSYKRN